MTNIALERIEKLFDLAEKRFDSDEKELADRYVELARKISMKSENPIPSRLKRKFCNNCGSFLRPGDNCEVRIKSKGDKILYRCLECGDTTVYGTEKE
ncbi:ribonuclease P protein component 4 [Candidatus Nanosalina sp. VS9-1]|uniref:ribonuclease P protein component 4 n=1 Tax=Candidatus Nanosalina sp. VS9-1 TaxID=3388566 RepID=UPI0039E1A8A9